MNILEVVSGYYPRFQAGVPKHIDRLTQGLMQAGNCSVTILAQDIGESNRAGILHERLPRYPLENFKIKRQWKYRWFDWTILRRGAALCRDRKIDVIHGHTYQHGGRQALRLGKKCNLPVVLTLHGTVFDAFPAATPPAWFPELLEARHIIVQKPSAREKLIAWGYPENRISILIGPVPISREVPHRSSMSSPVRLLFAGRFDPIKRPMLLVDLAEAILARGLPYVISAVGDGLLLPEVKHEARSRHVESILTLPGWCDNMSDQYHRHDVILGLSQTHNVSDLVLLEAMSYGLVPVVTRSKDIDYLIKDRQNGVICEDDVESILTGIRSINNHYEELSRAAAETAVAVAGSEHIVEMHRNIFHSVKNGK